MNLHRQAIRIVRDVIGIVLDWNNRYISDKEAMREITLSLLIHKDEENGRNKVVEEKKDEIAGEEEKAFDARNVFEDQWADLGDDDEDEEEKKQAVANVKKIRDSLKKLNSKKKFVAPLAISAFLLIVLVGGINLFDMISNVVSDIPNGEKLIQLRQTPTDDKAIKDEQFGEIIPIETTSLLFANAQSFSWMIPVILSGIGIGLFVVSRKSKNS